MVYIIVFCQMRGFQQDYRMHDALNSNRINYTIGKEKTQLVI